MAIRITDFVLILKECVLMFICLRRYHLCYIWHDTKYLTIKVSSVHHQLGFELYDVKNIDRRMFCNSGKKK
jgi:hypothetical protein